jgi:hypothetical protein
MLLKFANGSLVDPSDANDCPKHRLQYHAEDKLHHFGDYGFSHQLAPATSFAITRQLSQTFQRNRLNTSDLLTTPNKQTYPSHPSPPFNATTQTNAEKNDKTNDARAT